MDPNIVISLTVRVTANRCSLCRRGKVQQVDAKAGVAHVELLQQDQDQTAVQLTEGQKVDAAATADAPTEGQESAPADADHSRVFFLLKVRASACTAKSWYSWHPLVFIVFWEECPFHTSTRLRRVLE